MCFGREFHLIIMHFYFSYSMLWVSFQKSGYFFPKKTVFLEFRLIQSDFRSIEILFKKFSEPLPGSIDRTCFSINRTSWIQFFKNSVLTDSNTFSNFSLSLWLGKAPLKIFCLFSLKFLQGFSLSRPVKPLYPSFCSYFHDFMHYLMHFREIFKTFQIWDFYWINPLFLKLIIGFCFYIDIFMIYVG